MSIEAAQYCAGLKRRDFNSDQKKKRGLAAGFTFEQCVDHRLEDLKAALNDATNEQENNVCDQGQNPSG